jgi:hypothetical protein
VPGFQGVQDFCPGSDHCAGAGDGKLYVGAAAVPFTPEITESWTDVDGDQEWQSSEPYDDANGNGQFDTYWLFGGGRAANGVESDIEARALALRHNDTIVAIVYLDTIGMLLDDMEQIRQDPALASLGIDKIVIGTTHAHSTPDTIGISGQSPFETGYDPIYVASVRAAAAQAIAQAVNGARPARMTVAQTLILDVEGDAQSGTDTFAKDIRDPKIYDPTLTIARFTDEADDTSTIGTLVNWADHAEVALFGAGPDANRISANYPHWLRQTIEDGLPGEGLAGLGGVTVFVTGAIGGQIGTLRGTTPIRADGTPVTELGHEMDQVLGESVARRALTALDATGVAPAGELALSYRTTEYYARIDNTAFQTLFLIDVLAPHMMVGFDPGRPIGPDNVPLIPVRATYVQVGPLAFVTVPGEIHPELWVGVWPDGEWSWGNPVLDPAIVLNVPDLDSAPEPPFMRDLVLENDGVEFAFLAGCAEDYLGYIVPAYNYVLHPSNPYLEEAEGDHYEEVYSLGPDCEEHLIHPILELLRARPAP